MPSIVRLNSKTDDGARHPEDAIISRTAEAVLLALPLLLALCYFKFWELRYRGGGTLISHLSPGALGGFFRGLGPYLGDAVESTVLVPLLVVAVTMCWGSRGRLIGGYLIVQFLLLIATLGWAGTVAVGRLPTAELIGDFVRAAQRHPELVDPRGVLEPRTWLKAAAILSLGIAGPVLVIGQRWASRRLHTSSIPVVLAPLVPLMLAGVLHLGHTPLTGWHRGWFSRIITAMLTSDGSPDDTSLPNDAAILGAYAERFGSLAPAAPGRLRLVGTEPRHQPPNIVMVILETAPARDYPLDDSTHFPQLHQLLPTSLIAEQHYSASPSSSRSDFTILTSLYDGPGSSSPPHALYLRQPVRHLDALPGILARHGYATHYYYPADYTFPEDGWFVKWAGFQTLAPRATKGLYRMQTVADRLVAERDLFQRVISDLPAQDGLRPFFSVVRTLIGHYPIIDPAEKNGGPVRSLPQRKLALAQFQDSLIGALVSQLARRHLLAHTIILVTGDHGVRTVGEDPALDLSVLNETTFHVPLLIYAPGTFHKTLRITVPTSHIDLTPTLLALAGLEGGPYLHLGRVIWSPELATRPVCFATELQGGMMGCVAGHAYYMESPEGAVAFLSQSFHFRVSNLLAPGRESPVASRLHTDLETLRRVRSAWMGEVLEPDLLAHH